MAVNKVDFGGETLIDLTNDTITEDTLLYGETAHDKSGRAITGNLTVKNGRSIHYLNQGLDLEALGSQSYSETFFPYSNGMIQVNDIGIDKNGVLFSIVGIYDYGITCEPLKQLVKSPQKGIDYFTEVDKQELINEVIEALPAAEGVNY
jgi:hypothetical protein